MYFDDQNETMGMLECNAGITLKDLMEFMELTVMLVIELQDWQHMFQRTFNAREY